MAIEVSAAQAAFLVRRHERIVRGRIADGSLSARKEGNRWLIDVDNLDAVRGWKVDRARLAELQAQGERSVSAILARLDTFERELRDLRLRIKALEDLAHLDPLARIERAERIERGESGADGLGVSSGRYDATMRGPSESLNSTSGEGSTAGGGAAPGDDLPDGMMGATAFAVAHNVSASTVSVAMTTDKLPYREGNWKVRGRGRITRAIPREGHAAAIALWGQRPAFRHCPDCPA
jgi:hypothetical protein